MEFIEYLGIFGAFIILISMAIPSTKKKQNIIMRVINIIGSLMLIVYSAFLKQPAVANIFLNCSVVFINIFYIIRLSIDRINRKDNMELESL